MIRENPKTFFDKWKRETPGETLLAMLACPDLTFLVSQSRMCGSQVQISGSPNSEFHTYQFAEALREYHRAICPPNAVEAYESALDDRRAANERADLAGAKLTPFLRDEIVRKREREYR